MKIIHAISTLLLMATQLQGIAQNDSPLFQNEKPLPLRFDLSIRQIRKESNDSVYLPVQLAFQNDAGVWDSLASEMRVRGVFRKKNCHFPPLRVKFKKKAVENTIFAGNKSLKLVVPCQAGKDYNLLITKEYICYKLYETVSPFIFHTRLTDITLREPGKNKSKEFELRGFFIEDDDRVAKRAKGKIRDDASLHPLMMNDTNSVRHDLFQYMIGNTDWSATFQHNAKLMELSDKRVVPLAYDFDMSGVVNAPYATVDESLGISGPRERVYRGYCRNPAVFQAVRQEYLKAQPEMEKVLRQYEAVLGKGEYASLFEFIEEFFGTLKNDQAFTEKIVNACRK